MLEPAISLAIVLTVIFVGLAHLRRAEAQVRRADAERIWAARRDPMSMEQQGAGPRARNLMMVGVPPAPAGLAYLILYLLR
jgi:hypothetical protein